MAFTDFAAYKTALVDQDEEAFGISGSAGVNGRLNDLRQIMTPTPPTPTAAEKLDITKPGALNSRDRASDNFFLGARVGMASTAGTFILYDRLCQMGGLSGTSTAAQTVALPTATRYDEKGALIMVTIYALVGTTATTIQASYTDSTGTPNQKTKTVIFGGTNNREATRAILLPLADDDLGAISVETIQLGASTGTVGDFGVSLIKPIAMFYSGSSNHKCELDFLSGAFLGMIEKVEPSAHLCLAFIPQTSTVVTGTGSLIFGSA